jgi:hypothetical protein
MKRILGVLIVAAACCGAGLWTQSAQADESNPFRLLPTTQVASDGSTSVDMTPVRWGYGWRGYYGGYSPYRSYYGGYSPYRSYYGGYYPYRSYYGYRYPSYGSYSYGYRYPYYTGYRYPYYGYRYY